MEVIKVTDIIGTSLKKEDAILLRGCIDECLKSRVVLDFAGIFRVPSTFLCCLLTDLINKHGRDFIASHIKVRNLSNITDYYRVLLGTAFLEDVTLSTISG
ncbi:STAS-like domain-containing protein [Clostridium thermarum]|uniref:STAS-like domain-containing protein n=1 Tax=Clostridium thermarum TaxID=1716543 RepID=UPI0011204B03|nr:STAS-like domain-containing protein [Clostridium thermarum]